MSLKKKIPSLNKRITAKMIRLVDSSGKMVGIVECSEALTQAQSEGLDLVEVNPNSDPPVCKILDYGKIRYENQKKLQKARRKQNVVVTKEVKVRPNIEEHDYLFKVRNIRSFLNDNYKVKIILNFRGREIIYQEHGMRILHRIIKETEDIANVESKPSRTNNLLTMILSAK